jgi:hypothetical protein
MHRNAEYFGRYIEMLNILVDISKCWYRLTSCKALYSLGLCPFLSLATRSKNNATVTMFKSRQVTERKLKVDYTDCVCCNRILRMMAERLLEPSGLLHTQPIFPWPLQKNNTIDWYLVTLLIIPYI